MNVHIPISQNGYPVYKGDILEITPEYKVISDQWLKGLEGLGVPVIVGERYKVLAVSKKGFEWSVLLRQMEGLGAISTANVSELRKIIK